MKRRLESAFVDWTEGRRSPGLYCFGALAKLASWTYRIGSVWQEYRHQNRFFPALQQARLVVISSPMVGGVGKTPLAAAFARQFHEKGQHPVLVTLGYGRSSSATVHLEQSHQDVTVDDVGDEALMLWNDTGLPVSVGREPADVIRELDRSGRPDVIIFDDGVTRRWDGEYRLVVLSSEDCLRPVRYLPYGRWRVSPRFFRRAHGVAITNHSEIDEALFRRHRQRLAEWGFTGASGCYHSIPTGWIEWVNGSTHDMADRPDGLPYVFCGIGRPSSFFDQIKSLGIPIHGSHRFPDHHPYSRADIARLEKECHVRGCAYLLTTYKDAVKIDRSWIQSMPLYCLRTSMVHGAGDNLFDSISRNA